MDPPRMIPVVHHHLSVSAALCVAHHPPPTSTSFVCVGTHHNQKNTHSSLHQHSALHEAYLTVWCDLGVGAARGITPSCLDQAASACVRTTCVFVGGVASNGWLTTVILLLAITFLSHPAHRSLATATFYSTMASATSLRSRPRWCQSCRLACPLLLPLVVHPHDHVGIARQHLH